MIREKTNAACERSDVTYRKCLAGPEFDQAVEGEAKTRNKLSWDTYIQMSPINFYPLSKPQYYLVVVVVDQFDSIGPHLSHSPALASAPV